MDTPISVHFGKTQVLNPICFAIEPINAWVRCLAIADG